MVIFFDFLLIASSIYTIVERTELLPDFLDFVRGYGNIALWAAIGVFVIKYGVYTFQSLQDIKYMKLDNAADVKYGYIKLAVYPVCDLLRFAIILGLLSAFLSGILTEHVVINVYVDYFIYVGILLFALFVDYFCWSSETIRANLISTGIFVLGVVVFSRDLFIQGLRLV
jgi:hypothetical protein